ncbi:MAG: penicillin-insensitive murein endopeptidase [Bdellovibrionales bacterium]|nr:penicillin-insensitive murein endopeptidase [Bdellovibrionales bacterium]
MHYSSSKLTNFGAKSVVLVLFTLFAFGCAKFEPPKKQYTYSDPGTGSEVELRPSDYSIQAQDEATKDQDFVWFENPRVQVSLSKNTVNFKVTRVQGQSKEEIEIAGTFDEFLESWLSDTSPVNDRDRIKGYARCLSRPNKKDCPEMYVDVYYNQNGKIEKRQFIADPNISPAQSEIKSQLQDKKNTNNESIPVISSTNTQSADTLEQEETLHGIEENLVSDGNGSYVSPTPMDDFLNPLMTVKSDVDNTTKKESTNTEKQEKPATKENPTTTVKKESTQQKTITLVEPSQSSFPFNLTEGGRAKRRPNNGLISDLGTLFPKKGEGFNRISEDKKAYTTGYLADFFKVNAREFAINNPACGYLAIRNLSQAGGGTLNFGNCEGQKCGHHKSHQNGLDADVAYLPNDELRSVLKNGKVNPSFDYACNFEYLKYLNSIQLPSGDPAVYMIFVHTTLKQSLCLWAKEHNKNSPQDKAVFKTLMTTSDAHHDHMHIRLRCSPGHIDCWQGGTPNDPVKCE